MPQHGDIREDGKIFWGYNKKSKDGEDWRSPEVFARCKKRITVDNKQAFAFIITRPTNYLALAMQRTTNGQR
jgi:hypothetical protein